MSKRLKRSVDQKIAKLIRLANQLFNILLAAVVICALLLSAYAVWDSNLIYSDAAPVQYEIYRPTEEDPLSFDELRSINPEVFGWLTIYGTNIDYPIVQGKDNSKYLNTDAEGNYSLSGSIFLDYRNSPDMSDFNNLLYGHHMAAEMMFGDIDLFTDEEFFNTHRYGSLYCNGRTYGLDIFIYMHGDATDQRIFAPPAMTQAARDEFLQLILANAIYFRSIGVTTDDHLLIMSTCATGKRTDRNFLIAKIIDEVPENRYQTEEPVVERKAEGYTGPLEGEWHQVSYKAWYILLILLILIVLDFILRIVLRKKKQRKEKNQDASIY